MNTDYEKSESYDPGDWETWPQYSIFKSLVEEDGAPVEKAVEQLVALASPTAPNVLGSKPENPLGARAWHTCYSLVELAKRTPPQKQHKLVECVIQLQKVKRMDPETGLQMKSEEYLIWTDMPSLGYTCADEFHSYNLFNLDNKRSWGPGRTEHYENFHGLLAQLSSFSDLSSTVHTETDFSGWCFSLFSHAFKQEKSDIPAEFIIRAACFWFIFASNRLWANVKLKRAFGEAGEDGIMTQEVWEQSRSGLVALQSASLKESTSQLVDKALACMNEVDK